MDFSNFNFTRKDLLFFIDEYIRDAEFLCSSGIFKGIIYDIASSKLEKLRTLKFIVENC